METVKNLEVDLDRELQNQSSISHTRWATHGEEGRSGYVFVCLSICVCMCMCSCVRGGGNLLL